MCATCGCGDDPGVRISSVAHDRPEHSHAHSPEHGHPHSPEHSHPHTPSPTRTVLLEESLLAKNDVGADRNRVWLADRGVLAVNVMSSPGSGKTTLLERTIRELNRTVVVIEGDQETLIDAHRIRAAGARAVQINTGAGCHLDADMLWRGLHELTPEDGSLLFIENVGNLVCPALFDLGELARVVVMSVTEGADKPRKYPHMFATADLVLINKIDLLPYVDFDLDEFGAAARGLAPTVEMVPVSAKTGDGMAGWYRWLNEFGRKRNFAPNGSPNTRKR